MKLESIAPQADPQGRYKLTFEDGTMLRVYPTVIADLGLYAGMELSPQELDGMKQTAAAASAKMRAVRIVSAANISQSELKHRLVNKGETREDAEEAVSWLSELGLMDDAATAKQIVASGAAKGYGKARIRQMLYEKRIPKSLWDDALESMPEMGDAIDKFLYQKLRGRMPEREEKNKVIQALMRRGHSWNEIREALIRYGMAYEEIPEE